MRRWWGSNRRLRGTPKYSVQGKRQKSTAVQAARKYRKRLGMIPWIELAVGCYFAMTVWYAIANENYITVPFLILFVYGYWYTGLMSLLQGRFELLGRGSGSNAEEHSKPFPVGV